MIITRGGGRQAFKHWRMPSTDGPPPVPVPVTKPVLSGSVNIPSLLTGAPGTWSMPVTLTHKVQRGPSPWVDVSNGLTFTTSAADVGYSFRLSETGAGVTQFSDPVGPMVIPDPLQPYYDSGTIGIHFATDSVTTNVGGQVTALRNKGAFGSVFDASVSGNPIAISGNSLNLTNTSGIISTPNPAALSGVRFMFVVGVEQLVNGARIFGHSGASFWDITASINTSGIVLQGRYTSGTTVVLTNSPRVALPASGFVLIEVEFSTTQWLTWINGIPATGSNTSVPEFYVSTVGTGTSGARFLGLMGDVVGVLTGRSDSTAAIAAVKSVLNSKFGTPT